MMYRINGVQDSRIFTGVHWIIQMLMYNMLYRIIGAHRMVVYFCWCSLDYSDADVQHVVQDHWCSQDGSIFLLVIIG